ncbi:MAG: AmmeMemoRadiSam system protein B [Bacteroidota bacterium]|jgi:AmmeMemoRadiSam system protein B/AmmeMemoRadiSam system protein A
MNTAKIFFPFIFCIHIFFTDCQSQKEQIDRQPAVAGSFYPAQQEELNATLKQLFAKAVPSRNIKDVIAIISPHAGYVFSGEVAASAYNQIDTSKEYENIFILGSSHYIGFEGASVYSQGNFITPLGTVKVNTELANQLIKENSVFSNRTDAHAREHSLEVQLPFLQYRLKKDFKIVPIVLGTQSPETCKDIAKALQPYLNSKNLFIISTDFSHYPSSNDAKNIDKATADAILTNVPNNLIQSMEKYEAKGISNLATCLCGWTSVLTLMYMTENIPDITFTHIQYKNSGDTEYGEKNRVVGYNAIVIALKENNTRTEFKLNDKDKHELLLIARNTIIEYVKNRKTLEIDENDLSPTLKTKCGAFVTLKKHADLRGCIGRFDANEPLHKVVQDMAIASSTQDYRFTPVEPDEIPELEIEISVLTPMRRIYSVDEIELGKHGIYIRKGQNSGTFLPQVATETGWTKEEFLGHCAQDKAGIGWNGWKDAELYVYEALVFSEKK